MTDAEIERMAELEGDHWWYRSLRDLIARTVRTPALRINPGARVLDAGCGTGANLRLLGDLLAPSYAGGFDLSPVAVRLCRERAGGADVYEGDLRDPPIRAQQLDLVLSCDAVSIAGVADCTVGLRRLVGALRAGGLFVLHLPALGWLRSGHDEAIGTRDRVSVAQAGRLLADLGLEVEVLTYRLFALFPAVVGARLPSMLRGRARAARSDLSHTPGRVNRALAGIVSAENAAVVRGARFPCGSSVYAVGRKR